MIYAQTTILAGWLALSLALILSLAWTARQDRPNTQTEILGPAPDPNTSPVLPSPLQIASQ